MTRSHAPRLARVVDDAPHTAGPLALAAWCAALGACATPACVVDDRDMTATQVPATSPVVGPPFAPSPFLIAPVSLDPATTHRLASTPGGIKGAHGALLVPTREALIVWGDADVVTTKRIARVDVESGRHEEFFATDGILTATSGGASVWFVVDEGRGPQRLHHLDAMSGAVIEARAHYGASLAALWPHFERDRSAKHAVDDSGALTIEWWSYEPIPILFGRTRADYGLRADVPSDPSLQHRVYSRVVIPPPSSSAAPSFHVGTRPQLRWPSGPSRLDGTDRWQLDDGSVLAPVGGLIGVSGDMTPLDLPPPPRGPSAPRDVALTVQPFELRRHPTTLAPCAAQSEVVAESDTHIMTSNMPTPACARVTGFHVEERDTRRLIRSLTLGVGMPGAKAIVDDTLLFAVRRDVGHPAKVVVLDLASLAPRAHLELPRDVGAQTDIVALARVDDVVIAVTGWPLSTLVTWRLSPRADADGPRDSPR